MIVTTDYQLDRVPSPNLPLAPGQYDSRYQEQFNNVLRLYFNRLEALLAKLNTSNASGINFPYGAFEDNTTQSHTVNTANPMTFNQTDFSDGVTIVSGSRLTVSQAGIYNLQWSGQFQNTDTQLHDASVWLRQNGTDLAGSTGFISVPNSHGGTPGHTIAAWNYFVSLNANDHVEIYWSSDNAAVTLQAYPAGTSPTRPTTASVIATLNFVSAP